MKLTLKIEDQQAGALHNSAIRPMVIAAEATSLDRAVEILQFHLSAKNWLVGRGGHHVWIKHKNQYDAVQVATIREVPLPRGDNIEVISDEFISNRVRIVKLAADGVVYMAEYQSSKLVWIRDNTTDKALRSNSKLFAKLAAAVKS